MAPDLTARPIARNEWPGRSSTFSNFYRYQPPRTITNIRLNLFQIHITDDTSQDLPPSRNRELGTLRLPDGDTRQERDNRASSDLLTTA